ncbi:MAG TPA: hypothetical protein VHE13_08120 [Opitutus sp.]|nr:hypothetical protein [Opitutus sp.]
MHRRLVVSLLLACAVLAPLRAAPLERDLGEGLLYFRVHDLPADLPAAAPRAHALVLDLRYASATPAGAAALAAWMKSRASSDWPVFVLLNPGTSPALLPAFVAGHRPAAGVVTLAPRSSSLTPDIAVDVAPDADRGAYDALEHGAATDSLVTENADKPRHDEAELAHERANPPAEADDVDALPPEPADATAAPAPPAPVIDRLLERAIQLHRGLVALHRIAVPPRAG